MNLKMFFGSLDWQVDQILLTWDNENVEILEKNDPWCNNLLLSLSSWSWRNDLRTSFELYWSYCMFRRCVIDWFMDDFRVFWIVDWHWTNLADGGMILRPNLLRVKYTLLNVPVIGISNHLRMCWFTIGSRFSEIQVLERSAIVPGEFW